ncbi:MAG: hypothetical protein ACXWDL_09255 [Nocardioides sp.]
MSEPDRGDPHDTLPAPPDLIMRSFDVPDFAAAKIRLVAVENHCTGSAGYAGEKDGDPGDTTD